MTLLASTGCHGSLVRKKNHRSEHRGCYCLSKRKILSGIDGVRLEDDIFHRITGRIFFRVHRTGVGMLEASVGLVLILRVRRKLLSGSQQKKGQCGTR